MKNLAFILSTIALGGALIRLAEGSTNEITWDHFVSQLPPEERAEITKQTVETQAQRGIVASVTNVWEILTNAQLIATCAKESKEPLRADLLDALAATFAELPEGEQKFQAAAILYRYSKPVGREYLVSKLTDETNYWAAVILAMNREVEVASQIALTCVKEAQQNTAYDLIGILGQWKLSVTTQALLDSFQLNPQNADYAVALAKAGATQAVPQIQQLYDELPVDDPDRLACKGALAQLGANGEQHVSELIQLLSGDETTFEGITKGDVIKALGIAATTSAIDQLASIVANFVNNRPQPGTNMMKSVDMAVVAALALAEANPSGAVQPLTNLLRSLAAEHPNYTPWRQNRLDIANALLQVAGIGAETVLREQMGEQWWQHVLATKDLKRLPKHLWPGQNWVIGEYHRSELPY
jgi:hypothetical protein